MQCKLCSQEKPLIEKSHIIPRQFFHKMSENIVNDFGDVPHGERVGRTYSKETKSKQAQSGIHVPDILCKDCEQKLGVLDNYAQTILLKSKFILIENEAKTVWKLPNVDYKKLKLFFISVVWRSHICNHPFFQEVNLTDSLESDLRDIIIREEPGDENKFPILLWRYEGKAAEFFAAQKRQEPFEHYYFFLGNYRVIIKIDDKNIEELYKEILLVPNSPLMIEVKDHTTSREYKELLEGIERYKE